MTQLLQLDVVDLDEDSSFPVDGPLGPGRNTIGQLVDEIGTRTIDPHASTHAAGEADQIAGCGLACGQEPEHFTPTSATVGGMFQGIDQALGDLEVGGLDGVAVVEDDLVLANKGLQIYDAAEPTPNLRVEATSAGTLNTSGRLDAAGAEIAYDFNFEVDKAAGNYTGLRVNGVETAAPGTDNRLLTASVGDADRMVLSSSGQLALGGSAAGMVGLVQLDSADRTKRLVHDVSAIETATARTVTWPDADVDLQYSRPASLTVAGAVELATQAEVDAGTDTERAVTPATLAGAAAMSGVAHVDVHSSSSETEVTLSDAAYSGVGGVNGVLVVITAFDDAEEYLFKIGEAVAGSAALLVWRAGAAPYGPTITPVGVTVDRIYAEGATVPTYSGGWTTWVAMVWESSTRVHVTMKRSEL